MGDQAGRLGHHHQMIVLKQDSERARLGLEVSGYPKLDLDRLSPGHVERLGSFAPVH